MRTRLFVRGVLVRDGFALVNHTDDGFKLFGGAVKKWEPLVPALQREFWEELGLAVEVGTLLSISEAVKGKRGKRWRRVELIFAVQATTRLGPDVKAREPHLCPRWVPADSISVLLLGESESARKVFVSYQSEPDFREMVRVAGN